MFLMFPLFIWFGSVLVGNRTIVQMVPGSNPAIIFQNAF